MILPVLAASNGCDKCDLCHSARSPGIPSRRLSTPDSRKSKAVLIIGEKPGILEDQLGAHFVGETGNILENVLLRPSGLMDLADFYVTNAVRCLPPKNATITKKQYKACHPWLQADVETLKAAYDELILVAGGAGATRTLRGSSLEEGLKHQGETTLADCKTFYTYNPFILHPSREPSKIGPVIDHLRTLKEYLETGTLSMQMDDAEVFDHGSPRCLLPTPTILSLDIESYGAVEKDALGRPMPRQTVFHPQRAMLTDGCRREDLVQTVALAWRAEDGSLHSAFYNVTDPNACQNFRLAMATAPYGITLLGMNLPFDLMFLRAWEPGTFDLERWKLWDLSISNYLHSEVRPERSLKTISPLLSITDYDEEVNLKAGERYLDASHPRLRQYNIKDAVATLLAHEKLERWIKDEFPDTAKMSTYCRNWYHDRLRYAIYAGETGISIDRKKLEDLDARLLNQVNRLDSVIRKWYSGIPQGEGSQRWTDRLVTAAVSEAGLLHDRRLIRTAKTRKISSSGENINLLVEVLGRTSKNRAALRALQLFREKSKLRNTFTKPLLVGRQFKTWTDRRGIVLDVGSTGRVYPTWYIVPGQFEDQSSGGTVQGRCTCKNPAVLTFPEVVKETLSTRHEDGCLIGFDLSQIELRTAALLSGDPVMVREYVEGVDRHLMTALDIMRAIVETYPADAVVAGIPMRWYRQVLADAENGLVNKHYDGIKVWRQLGKTLNFLMLFMGGARKAQETAARDVGLLLPLGVWEKAIARYREKYPVFIQWQQELLELVGKRGRLELPLIGQSRWFRGGKLGIEEATSEIVNMPIQTSAANALLSAWTAVTDEFGCRGMEAVSGLTIYDAMYVECPRREKEAVIETCTRHLEHPPYWTDLERLYGRTVPVECEWEVMAERHPLEETGGTHDRNNDEGDNPRGSTQGLPGRTDYCLVAA